MEEQLFTLPETNRAKLEDLIWVVGTTKFKPVFDQVFAFSDARVMNVDGAVIDKEVVDKKFRRLRHFHSDERQNTRYILFKRLMLEHASL